MPLLPKSCPKIPGPAWPMTLLDAFNSFIVLPRCNKNVVKRRVIKTTKW